MENKQTNKQENALASHFKSAVFDIERWDAAVKNGLPNFVKKVHQQVEICPETSREHYQVHLELNRQQRPSAINSWWGGYTKWFAVKGKDHIANSISYTSKKESAREGTHRVIENEEEYLRLHDILLQIAEEFEPNITECQTDHDPIKALRLLKEYEEQFLFKNASKWIVKKDIKWISKLSAPFLERAWNYYHAILLDEVKKGREGGEGPSIIEGTNSIVDAMVPPPPNSAVRTFKINVKTKHNGTKAVECSEANEGKPPAQ